MQYYGKILCVSFGELVGIMSKPNIDQLRHRGILQQVVRGCRGQEALFAVDSLPNRFKTEVLSKYAIPEKMEDQKLEIILDGSALMFYQNYRLPDGRNLPIDKINELIQDASILNALDEKLKKSDSLSERIGKKTIKRGEFWQKAANYLMNIQNGLPQNARWLQKKYNDYKKNGYSALISQSYCNQNSLKVKDDKQRMLTLMLSHWNNFDNCQIAKMYNAEAEKQGWEKITDSTVAIWRQKTDLTTSAARLGSSTFRNIKSMNVQRSRPTAPFLFWSLDGWDCELLYQTVNEKGVTTYTNRMVVEVVLDPCCDYIIGYAVGTSENAELITKAIKNALQHSAELFGFKHRTMQLQSDHFALKAMQPIYAAVADKVTPARVKNAKAKPVERFFNYLNKNYCQTQSNWAGFGITTNPKKQPNSEAINTQKKDFPDADAVIRQIESIIELDRKAKHDEFVAMYSNLKEEHKQELTNEMWLMYFGEKTAKTNRINAGGLTPTILGLKRHYDCFDVSFRDHAFDDFVVYYDADDLTKILATSVDGTLRYILEQKYVQPMALAERKDGDAEQLQRIKKFNQELEQTIIERQTEIAEGAKNVVRLPQTAQILKRFLLTDSNGQHKTPLKQAKNNNNNNYEIF